MKTGTICGLSSLAVALLAPGGCGSGAPASVCDELAAVNCAWMQKCFVDYFRQQYGDDLDACVALASSDDCMEWTTLSGVAVKRETYIACTPLFERLDCEDEFPEECRAQPGTLEDGARCIILEQCQSRHCYFTPPDSLLPDSDPHCGTCTTANVAATHGDLVSQRSCRESSECPWQQYCRDEVCVPRLEVGAACVTGEDVCREPMTSCIDGTCKAPHDVQLGERCGPTPEGYGNCLGSRCSDDGAESRCVEWTRKGQPCRDRYECEGGFVCYGGVCRALTADMCRG